MMRHGGGQVGNYVQHFRKMGFKFIALSEYDSLLCFTVCVPATGKPTKGVVPHRHDGRRMGYAG